MGYYGGSGYGDGQYYGGGYSRVILILKYPLKLVVNSSKRLIAVAKSLKKIKVDYK